MQGILARLMLARFYVAFVIQAGQILNCFTLGQYFLWCRLHIEIILKYHETFNCKKAICQLVDVNLPKVSNICDNSLNHLDTCRH